MSFSNNRTERIRDMKYFQAILPDHPIVMALVDQLGWEGYAFLLGLMALYAEIGEFELTEKILSRRFGLNRRKVSRIFPILSESFAKVCQSLGKFDETLPKFQKVSQNIEKVSENISKVSESLPKLEGQNPDGSTRAHADAHVNNINNKYKNINNTDQEFSVWYAAYPHKVGKGQAEKAYASARKKASAEQLLEGLERYRKNKPDYAAWRNPATWLNGLGWEDQYASKSEPVAGPSHGRKLMASKQIKNRFTEEVVKTEDLTIDKHDQIWTKAGNRFADNEFEPMEETANV